MNASEWRTRALFFAIVVVALALGGSIAASGVLSGAPAAQKQAAEPGAAIVVIAGSGGEELEGEGEGVTPGDGVTLPRWVASMAKAVPAFVPAAGTGAVTANKTSSSGLPYLLRVPPAAAKGAALKKKKKGQPRFPLLVFLHGAGESGTEPWGLVPGFDPASGRWKPPAAVRKAR